MTRAMMKFGLHLHLADALSKMTWQMTFFIYLRDFALLVHSLVPWTTVTLANDDLSHDYSEKLSGLEIGKVLHLIIIEVVFCVLGS